LEADVRAIRQIVIDKLAKHRLPLLRIWYHPRVNGVAVRSVFSPRFDVDRAITNLARIRNLEMKYDVSSTLYLRAFCPFYSDDAIKKVLSLPGHPEIALHGEFITHARKYGDEMAAAVAEKEHLEQLTGLPVLGIAMHGGELAFNKSKNTDDAIRNAGLLYNTTIGPTDYYFPYRKVVDGQVSKCYTLPHALSDFRLLPFKPTRRVVNGHVHKSYSLSTLLKAVSFSSIRDYNRMFYEKTIERIDEVYEQNGVFVFTLHPAYFGFLSYLANPKNLILLLKFSLNYFKRSR